jgi:predicted transcriptional regulator
VRRASLFGDAVHAVVAPETTPESIRETLERDGVDVREVRATEATLEDIFIERVETVEHA